MLFSFATIRRPTIRQNTQHRKLLLFVERQDTIIALRVNPLRSSVLFLGGMTLHLSHVGSCYAYRRRLQVCGYNQPMLLNVPAKRAHIVRILRTQIARVGCFNLACGHIVLLFAFHRRHLRLGENRALLSHQGVQHLETVFEARQVMA